MSKPCKTYGCPFHCTNNKPEGDITKAPAQCIKTYCILDYSGLTLDTLSGVHNALAQVQGLNLSDVQDYLDFEGSKATTSVSYPDILSLMSEPPIGKLVAPSFLDEILLKFKEKDDWQNSNHSVLAQCLQERLDESGGVIPYIWRRSNVQLNTVAIRYSLDNHEAPMELFQVELLEFIQKVYLAMLKDKKISKELEYVSHTEIPDYYTPKGGWVFSGWISLDFWGDKNGNV